MNLPPRLLAFLSLAFTLSGAQESPTLSLTPVGDTHTRALGKSIVFICSVNGLGKNANPDLKWINNEGREIVESSGRLYVERDSPDNHLQLKLYITGIVANDAGEYTCEGTLEGTRQQKKTRLDLFKDITYDHAPTPQYPVLHTDALIECQVSGQPMPTVSYRYKGMKLSTGGRYVYETNGLRILNITEEDNGVYTCQAEVPADGRLERRQLEVIVHIPPKITAGPVESEGIEDHELTITCSATGKPAPQYEWFKDSSDAPLSSNNRISVDRNAGRVTFVPLKKEDEGIYRCRALNDAGSDEGQGMVKVIVPPEIVDYKNVTGREGQSQKLLCVANGDPEPQMTFRKLDSEMEYVTGENEGGRILVEDVGTGQLQLTIKDLTPEDTSSYTCKAINTGGNDMQNGVILVQYPPRFAPDHPRRYYNWAGKRKNITCTALGEPEPFVEWFRGDHEFNEEGNNETFKIMREPRKAVLQVTVREEDQGWIYGDYRCNARNELGEESLKIEMERATTPGTPNGVTVKEQSPTLVVFTVSPPEDDGGVPVFGYRVEYEGQVQDFQIGQDILIENLRASTRYIFHFRAKNDVGVGDSLEYAHNTEAIRMPYTVTLVSEPYGQYPFTYVAKWEKPRTGGLPIKEYKFQYRRVQTEPDSLKVIKPLEDWTVRKKEDSPDRPMLFYELKRLKPNEYYELQISARNAMGWSTANSQFVFHTAEGVSVGQKINRGAPAVRTPASMLLFLIAMTTLLLAL